MNFECHIIDMSNLGFCFIFLHHSSKKQIYIYFDLSHKQVNIFTKKSSHEYINKKSSHEYIHKEFAIKKLWVEIQTPYFPMWEETSYFKKKTLC